MSDIYDGDIIEQGLLASDIKQLTDKTNIYGATVIGYKLPGATNTYGYLIKREENEEWHEYIENMLTLNNTSQDSLYVISEQSDALSYWLSSPSADGNGNIIRVGDGMVTNNSYSNPSYGFRPIICLNADVQIEQASNFCYMII